jgi:Zn-dependent protease/CBS domain-containing protein
MRAEVKPLRWVKRGKQGMAEMTHPSPSRDQIDLRNTGRQKTRMGGRATVPLGRIMDIRIGLDYSWFLVFALLTWMLAGSYYPSEYEGWSQSLYWFMGAVSAISLFVCVLLHELGHSFVALRFNVPVRSITLFIFGGVAQMGAESPSAKAEFQIAIAGPIVSLLLAGVFTVMLSVIPPVETLTGLLAYLALLNLALALFNLIPGFPLDGGRIFRAFLWSVTKDMRQSTIIAANTGRVVGFLFIMFGVWRVFAGDFGGLWIVFIGWFLDNAASAQVNQAMSHGLLSGHLVSQAMSGRLATVPSSFTLQRLLDDYVLAAGRRWILVDRGSETIGLVTLHLLKQVPRSEWATKTVAEAMIPLQESKRLAPESELWAALQMMDRDGVNQLPVMSNNHIVGMLTREDVVTYLRVLQEVAA